MPWSSQSLLHRREVRTDARSSWMGGGSFDSKQQLHREFPRLTHCARYATRHGSDQGDALLYPIPSILLRASELQVRMMVGQEEMIRRASASAETRVTALVALLA